MSDLKKLLLLLGAMTLLRILWAMQMPMFSDEAYYWLWNWHLALGYYDHPPMLAWASYLLGGRILGSPLALRTAPIVLGVCLALAFYALGRAMFPRSRVAWLAAALMSVAPSYDVDAMFLTPDNTLVVFVTLTWLFFWRAAEKPNSLALWLTTGAMAGLSLLSKFHAWVLLPPLWMFLAISPRHRAVLRKPGPWLALVVALIVLSPNLFWNWQHAWLNYAFQWRRSALPKSHFDPMNMVNYLIGPMLMLGPPLYFGCALGLWAGWRQWRKTLDARWLYLLCAGVPLPLFLGLLTPLTKISMHWPSSAYGALLLLAVGLIEEGHLLGPRFYKYAFYGAGVLTLALHILPNMPNTFLFNRWLAGDRAVAARLLTERQDMLAGAPATPVWYMTRGWRLASLVAFYNKVPFGATSFDGDLHNFRLWDEPRADLPGASAVIAIENEKPMQNRKRLKKKYARALSLLHNVFENVEIRPSVIVYEDGSIADYLGVATKPPIMREFLIFRGEGFHLPADEHTLRTGKEKGSEPKK